MDWLGGRILFLVGGVESSVVLCGLEWGGGIQHIYAARKQAAIILPIINSVCGDGFTWYGFV